MKVSNRAIVLVVSLVVAAIFVYIYAVRSKLSATASIPITHAEIVLTPSGFKPAEVHLALHGSVTFSTTAGRPFWPAYDPHPSHTIYPAFDPKVPIEPNATWTFTFDSPGRWQFHDHIRSYFTGVIYVDS